MEAIKPFRILFPCSLQLFNASRTIIMETSRRNLFLHSALFACALLSLPAAHGFNITSVKECGKLSSNKIQANDTTRLLQEPWQVAVYERLKDHLIYSCAGALVEEKLVLISAACFDRTTDPMKFMVVVNPSDGNLTANAADNSTLFADVDSIVLHPSYKADAGYVNSIAMMKISYRGPSENRHLMPVCVPTDESHPGESGRSIGAYNADDGPTSQLILTNLTVEHERKCIQEVSDAPAKGQFCALPQNAKIPLRRMGSSPFIVEHEGKHYLKGLIGPASMTQKDWPVFVISVPYYLAWIDETAVNIMNIKY